MKKISLLLAGVLMFRILIPASLFAEIQTYQDGVYEGVSRESIFGKVRINVVIKKGRIVDIQYLNLPDWYPEKVKETMTEQIIEKQSSRVDGVTGATVSSELISGAVSQALEHASASGGEAPSTNPAPASVNQPSSR